MKAYIIVKNYYDYCDNWKTTVGYFSNKDVAEYVCAELQKSENHPETSYWVEPVEIRENLFDMSEDLDKIYQEIKKNL